MLEGDLRFGPVQIHECDYIMSNRLYGKGTKLGYAKPLMRRSLLETHKLRYNETMPIGEDYDLVVRLLAVGARMVTIPEAMYFYRKHDKSISHRLDARALAALKKAAEGALQHSTPHAEVTAAHAARLNSISRAIAFDEVIRALKEGKIGGAIQVAIDDPRVVPMLRMPVMDRLKRILPNPFRKRHPEIERTLAELRSGYGA